MNSWMFYAFGLLMLTHAFAIGFYLGYVRGRAVEGFRQNLESVERFNLEIAKLRKDAELDPERERLRLHGIEYH